MADADPIRRPSSDAHAEAVRRRSILHVDMDAFFVSVELIDRPELRGTPVIVGGTGQRGVVAAASYEARAHGVRSAQPTAIARRLCPNAVFLDGRHERYREVSAGLMAIFASVTPFVEPLSLDEAFLDVSGRLRALGPAPSIAATLRDRVHRELGVTCSVGVAHNKFLAKLASESAKPTPSPSGPIYGSGVAVVDPDAVERFLWPLPASAVWGVGPVTLAKLQRFGVVTVGDIARLPEPTLVAALGTAAGRHLHQLAFGLDDRPVVSESAAKSISHEQTFGTDIADRESLERVILRLSDAVASRLRGAGCVARTVTMKVRFGDFRTISRSVTPDRPIASTAELHRVARDLLAGVDVAAGVRLLGVGVQQLGPSVEQVEQLSLLDSAGQPDDGRRAPDDLDRAMDEIRDRFGSQAIGPASLVEGSPSGSARLARFEPGAQQWGPTGNGE